MRSGTYHEVLEAAANNGCRTLRTKGSHFQLLLPDGKTVIHTGSSPQDWRSARNLRAQLARNGVRVRS